MQIENIWYASQDRANSSFCFRAYDDEGVITLEDKRIVFKGQHKVIIIDEPINIYLRCQKFKWTTWLVLLVFALPIYVIIYSAMSPLPNIIKAIFIISCVCSLVVGV